MYGGGAMAGSGSDTAVVVTGRNQLRARVWEGVIADRGVGSGGWEGGQHRYGGGGEAE